MTLESKIVEILPRLNTFAHRFYGEGSEDLVQNAVCKVLEKRSYVEMPDATFFYYMTVIVKNEYVNLFRRRVNRGDVRDIDGKLSDKLCSDADTYEQMQLKDLHGALNELPTDYKDVLVLRLQGYKYKELSKILKAPLGTIKSRVFLATQQLKRVYEQNV